MSRRRDDRELEKMHQANAIVLRTLDVLMHALEPGITTAELDRIAAAEIAREGATPAFKGYRGFPASLCVSVNDEVVHGIPSPRRRLEEGDIVSLDLGAIVDGYFGDNAITAGVGKIEPDLEKLDLATRVLIPLDQLRAADSGRIVGPKAAKLGELKHHYPEAVAEGLAIPFGIFRGLLDQPMSGTGLSIYDWMVREYRAHATLPRDSEERRTETEQFRHNLETWILNTDPGEPFRHVLEVAVEDIFGPEENTGIFVRSDTNVEDLPGFTGAGLNLTVPNVVGFDALLTAIQRVWASPFSARAFAWRQALMSQPEHVYPAILLLRTVPSEKSGVLVTRDIDTGDPGWLSVAVNEGIGGAVDGQPAESLRLERSTGRIRLLAQASTPWRRDATPGGGITRAPVSGSDTVLLPGEAALLIEFAHSLPERFPPITDDQGQPAPADVEFGFVQGQLRLFQIRPFLESSRARASAYLTEIDRGLIDPTGILVDLGQLPQP